MADAAVAMRLHAAIFALSQGAPAVGIDYARSGRGKVSELFEDRGMAESVVSLRGLDGTRLSGLLTRFTSADQVRAQRAGGRGES